MTKCQCQGIQQEFGEKDAQKELEAYREEGPVETTEMLIDALTEQGLDGLTLLDIGGGVGAIQHALLSAGAISATAVEASTAFAKAAEEEAEDLGWSERIAVQRGDFVDLAPSIAEHDVVTLDRVVCCYDDMKSLVELSASRARRLYGLVHPRDTLWNKIGFGLGNVFFWITRSPFRFFIHPDKGVQQALEGDGLKRIFHDKTFIWQVSVYARS